MAIKLLEMGRTPLSALITHRYGFKESQLAFERTMTGDSDVIQSVIKCQEDFV